MSFFFLSFFGLARRRVSGVLPGFVTVFLLGKGEDGAGLKLRVEGRG